MTVFSFWLLDDGIQSAPRASDSCVDARVAPSGKRMQLKGKSVPIPASELESFSKIANSSWMFMGFTGRCPNSWLLSAFMLNFVPT